MLYIFTKSFAGNIYTSEKHVARRFPALGATGKYENIRIGVNSRLDTMQAAILIEKLKIFPDELLKRQVVADNYLNLLNSKSIQLPQNDKLHKSAWAQFTIQVDNRDKLQKELANNKIPSIIYYPIPLSKQKAFFCVFKFGKKKIIPLKFPLRNPFNLIHFQ